MVCFYMFLPRILKHQDSVLLCHNLVPENISCPYSHSNCEGKLCHYTLRKND